MFTLELVQQVTTYWQLFLGDAREKGNLKAKLVRVFLPRGPGLAYGIPFPSCTYPTRSNSWVSVISIRAQQGYWAFSGSFLNYFQFSPHLAPALD